MNVLELLNSHDGLLRVKDAWLPSRKERLEFFAVRVGSISLVLPGDHTGDMRAAAEQAQLRVTHPLPTRRVLLPELFVNVVRVHGIADLDGGMDPISQTVIPASPESLAAIGQRPPRRRTTDPGPAFAAAATSQNPSPDAGRQIAPQQRTNNAALRSTSTIPRRPTPLSEPTSTDRDTPFRRG